MMQPLYGGAAARPFVTHHNTLDIDLYLRIAPELYLKRLVVGGLERVYEINRNFRNEGLSTHHNPEFTMLEFYQAYTDYRGLMDLSEELLRQAAIDATGRPEVEFEGHKIDFSCLARYSMREAIVRHWEGEGAPTLDDVANPEWLRAHSGKATAGEALTDIFERHVEEKLIQPTMIYDYPVETSPLSKNKPDDPAFVERFEIYAAGMEIGNAYTELNDPQEQRRRFEMQLGMRERGDEEAHQMDEDYVRALSYGMPPTGGEGHRDRPADHDPDRIALHSRRDSVPAAAAGRPDRSDRQPARTGQTVKTFELFIAGPLSAGPPQGGRDLVITAISVLGVAAGVMALVIALAVTNGFSQHAAAQSAGRDGAHQRDPRQPGDGIENWPDLVARIRKVPHVTAVSPALYSPTFLTGPIQSKGAYPQGHRRRTRNWRSATRCAI